MLNPNLTPEKARDTLDELNALRHLPVSDITPATRASVTFGLLTTLFPVSTLTIDLFGGYRPEEGHLAYLHAEEYATYIGEANYRDILTQMNERLALITEQFAENDEEEN